MRLLPIALMLAILAVTLSYAADLAVRPRHGKTFEDRVLDGPVDKFGVYGDAYYARRWRRMCAGPARYDAMREANDLGKANPC